MPTRTQDVFGVFDSDTGDLLALRQNRPDGQALQLSALGGAARAVAQVEASQTSELQALATAGQLVPGTWYLTASKQIFFAVSATEFLAPYMLRYSGASPVEQFGAAVGAPAGYVNTAGGNLAGVVESLILGGAQVMVQPEFNYSGKMRRAAIVQSEFLPVTITAGDASASIGFRGPKADFQSGLGFCPALPFSGTVSLNGTVSEGGPIEVRTVVTARGTTNGAASATLRNIQSTELGPVNIALSGFLSCLLVGELVLTARTYVAAPFAPAAEAAVYRRQLVVAVDALGAATILQNVALGTDFESAGLAALAVPTVAAAGSDLVITATGVAGKLLDWRAVYGFNAMQTVAALWPEE